MNSPRVSLAALLGTQAVAAFNDTAATLMFIALTQQLWKAAGHDPAPAVAAIAAMLALPYILFGPVCGWMSDRFPKRAVINASMVAQVLLLAALALALRWQSFAASLACFFLLAVQTAVLAPAKRGIIVEYAGEQRLSRYVGAMEMLFVGAILGGSWAGGAMFSALLQRGGDLWLAGFKIAVLLTGVAVMALAAFQLAQPTTAHTTEPFRASLFFRHRSMLGEVWRDRRIFRAMFGISFFYGLMSYFASLLPQVAYRLEQGGILTGRTQGWLLFLVGSGAAAGNFFAGWFSRGGIELGLVPFGGVILSGCLLALGVVPHGTPEFGLLLVASGFATGLFVVPLYAFIQRRSGPERRGRVLAGVSVYDSMASFLMAGVFWLVAGEARLGWPPAVQFLLLAGISIGLTAYALHHLPHETTCATMRLLGPLFYRVRVRGVENFPPGGALVVCNHLSYVDAVVLQLASPRTLRFVAFAGFAQSPVVRFMFRALGVIPVAANKPLKGIRLAVEAMQQGDLVCVFPEGAISRTGQLMRLKGGFEMMARQARAPVVPAVVDGLWGSVFSFAGNKYLWKSPRLMPTHVFVQFGRPVPHGAANLSRIRRELLDLGEEAFHERPALKRNVARECVRALAKRPWHVEVVDRTGERRAVKAGQLLAAAAALSRHLRRTVPEKRVGVVLPPGAGAHIANLAIACAGKVPVNLNFTAGRAAVEASLRLGEISTVITADAMRAKVPHFPFPERTLDLRREIEAAGGKRAILPWLAAAWLLPNQWVATLLGLPNEGDCDEAGLLFTSGSSGEPKGVVLTHRNILANCAQVSSLSILPQTATIVGCLPIFHSFGFTVTLWYPILRGCRVVTIPSPLDTRKIVEAIHAEKATVMVGAPTFVRPFLRKASREELSSLNLVVTGAEKLPQDLYDAFLEQFGIEILQGYGLTETTPVTSVNQHNPPVTTSTAEEQLGKKTGSVGRLLPGMTARIADPDTGEDLPVESTGMLWLRGANIFPGYLKDREKTEATLRDGWFISGDLGRFDEEGFLHIEGRLSRFSKIGGEMVPHGTVETKIAELLSVEQTDGPVMVVVGIPDTTKGEALVLLTTLDLTAEQVRGKLLDAGLPNLWVPRIVRKVERIPLLGSGKTDLKGCRSLALELAHEAGAR